MLIAYNTPDQNVMIQTEASTANIVCSGIQPLQFCFELETAAGCFASGVWALSVCWSSAVVILPKAGGREEEYLLWLRAGRLELGKNIG